MNLSNPHQRAFFYSCLYLGALFICTMVMWWITIVGGSPFEVRNIGVLSSTGLSDNKFKPGQVAAVRRRFCSNKTTPIEYFPSLYDAKGYWYPLQSGVTVVQDGCLDSTHAFVVPDLPPGEYTYISTIKFQNNLIGRDESETFPPLTIRVTR